jgi:membrane protease YdiL (CAAX protease family)
MTKIASSIEIIGFFIFILLFFNFASAFGGNIFNLLKTSSIIDNSRITVSGSIAFSFVFCVLIFYFSSQKTNYKFSYNFRVTILTMIIAVFFGYFLPSSKTFQPDNSTLFYIFVFSVVLIAPLSEEYICRSVAWDFFSERTNLITVCIISNLLFLSLHFNDGITKVVSLLPISMVLTYARLKGNTVNSAIFTHILYNFILLIFYIVRESTGM